jgi:hypothetical protein
LVKEQLAQANLLRDVYGTLPFRTPAIMPSCLEWNNGIVRWLAEEAYEQRLLPSGQLVCEHLAVIADALEEAGATDPELLSHLRSPGPHVRGCYVLDLLIGRSGMAMANKQKRLFEAVREVLFRDWDPIGVNDNPHLADEYDDYARSICRLLEAGADEVKLAAHLGRFWTNVMGLSDSEERRERDRIVAQRLRELVGQREES